VSRSLVERGRAWKRPLLLGLTGLSVAAAVVSAVVSLAFWQLYSGADIPSFAQLQLEDPTVLLDVDGEVMDTLESGALQRKVALDALPPHVPAAVLAAEDRAFHDHRGFSARAIARAAIANLRAREVRQGGSTLTQQYVALALGGIDDSFAGKFREVAVAARLDDELSKEQILELYLNSVPLGRTADGVEAGAQLYFGVSASELDLEQAATLAGMIAAPTAFDPARNPEGAATRRDFVLRGMVATGAIEPAEADRYLGTPAPELREGPLRVPGPEGYVLAAVREQLPSLLEGREQVASGLVVHTTMDPRAQELAISALRDALADRSETGAIVTIESGTGAIRALVGGTDPVAEEFNVATAGRRQVGSSFKTFVLAELVARGYHPDSTRIDAPEQYAIADESVGGRDDEGAVFRNASGQGHGEVTARQAVVRSINTPFIQLGEALGFEEVVAMARTLGIEEDLPPFPSVVLGAADLPPVQLAAAYATLSADGRRTPPYLIERVETVDGEVLHEHRPEGEQVIDANVARVVNDVLAGVISDGTGGAADIGRPAVGKTGTTNDHRDAWFVGHTPDHATAVWVGNLDNAPMDGVTGGSVPATVWSAYMRGFVEPFEVSSFPEPDLSDLLPLQGLERPTPPPTPPSTEAPTEGPDVGGGDGDEDRRRPPKAKEPKDRGEGDAPGRAKGRGKKGR
jgi:penicillin-binding protein 1A